MAMTKREQLLRIKNEYRTAHNNEAASTRTMAEWAVANGKYALPSYAAVSKCAEELADAMRTEYLTDGRGRRVRVNHARRTQQGTLWDHIDTIPRSHMELSVAQRRREIVGEVKQIKTDVDHFNEKHADEAPLQVSFNFENDLADAGLLTPSASVQAKPETPPPPAPRRSTSPPVPFRPSSRPPVPV